jgi:hypothetical protein
LGNDILWDIKKKKNKITTLTIDDYYPSS